MNRLSYVLLSALVMCSLHIDQVKAQPTEWQWTTTNASGVMLGQVTINGVPAEAADWIGAFDTAGNCAGAAPIIVNEELAYFNLPIYGDDAGVPPTWTRASRPANPSHCGFGKRRATRLQRIPTTMHPNTSMVGPTPMAHPSQTTATPRVFTISRSKSTSSSFARRRRAQAVLSKPSNGDRPAASSQALA